MPKKYTDCPTCGGLCYYPSHNFEQANIKVNALSFSEIRNELEYALDRISYLEQLLEARNKQDLLGLMTVDDLWKAFKIRAQGFTLLTWSEIFKARYPHFDSGF